MKTTTIALAAIAALALPAGAVAKKPADAPKKPDAPKKTDTVRKVHGKAFTLKGTTAATALPVADGALTGALTLDPTSANKHARALLTLTKADLRGTATETFGETGDAVVVKYVGLTATDALQATDVVKVLGKVKGGTLDVRRITVTREPTDS